MKRVAFTLCWRLQFWPPMATFTAVGPVAGRRHTPSSRPPAISSMFRWISADWHGESLCPCRSAKSSWLSDTRVISTDRIPTDGVVHHSRSCLRAAVLARCRFIRRMPVIRARDSSPSGAFTTPDAARWQTKLKPWSFWVGRFGKSESPDVSRLRVSWAWNDGRLWQAANTPRLAFAGASVLYKLYVIQSMSADREKEDQAFSSFVAELLPVVNEVLKPTSKI